jgi:hypothetical protein
MLLSRVVKGSDTIVRGRRVAIEVGRFLANIHAAWMIALGFSIVIETSSVAANDTSPTYQETVSFIFNSSKKETGDPADWHGTLSPGFNTLTDFDQENCTVHLRSYDYPRNGLLYFNGITSWATFPRNTFWELRLVGEKEIFRGEYYDVGRGQPFAGCTGQCVFEIPDEHYRTTQLPDALAAAFDHLFGNFCRAGQKKF